VPSDAEHPAGLCGAERGAGFGRADDATAHYWKLHLSPNRKTLLLATFVLGYSVIFFSVGWLVTIAKLKTGLKRLDM
jgi:hypothetical protein